MNEIKIILKQHRIKFEDGKDKITFPTCPLCQVESQAALNERYFLCVSCSDAINIKEFFKKLAIPYDDSPTDFADLAAGNADQLLNPERLIGVSTGYEDLDKLTGGLKAGHLYILAAETGMGKSVFAANLVVNAIIKAEKGCSYFDLENGRYASEIRFAPILSGKPVSYFTQQTKTEYLKIVSQLQGKLIYRDHVKLAPFILNQQGEAMAKAIVELIRHDVSEKQTRIIVIDPLENFETVNSDYSSIAKVIIQFKDLAQELDISILVLHHLRKPQTANNKLVSSVTEVTPAKYRIPTKEDVLGSSKIVNMATDVWTIVRQKDSEGIEEKGKTLFRSLKEREGSGSGDVYFVMNLQNLKFAELSTREEYYGGQNQLEVIQ